jgi:hypothetical protein
MARFPSGRREASKVPLVDELFEIRSRSAFSHDDIKTWIVDLFREFFGIARAAVATEVVIFAESRGRADIILESYVAVEVKKNLEREFEDAFVKIRRALLALKQQGSVGAIAIGTDGLLWRFYTLSGGEPFCFYDFILTSSTGDKALRTKLFDGLSALREEKKRIRPTPAAMSDAFKPERPAFKEARRRLVSGADELVTSRPEEFIPKFRPWLELFSFVYNSFQERCESLAESADDLESLSLSLLKLLPEPKPDGRLLRGVLEVFLRHTYMALLAKVLASTVALGEEAVSRKMLEDPRSLASGDALTSEGVHIVDRNDFFAWATEASEAKDLLKTLLLPLKRFTPDYTDDIFRHLYESIVDDETRHELGEFFTPRWMAELVTQDAVRNSSDRVLDPACGSGTFLLMALQRKASLGGPINTEKVDKYLDEIWGIDVNPLSVLMARTNLYLLVTSILRGKRLPSEFNPNVYVADTFILPRFDDAKQRSLSTEPSAQYVFTKVTPDVVIPVHLRLSFNEVRKITDSLGEAIQADRDIPAVVASFAAELQPFCNDLLATIRRFRSIYGDNIWIFILRNYGVPPVLRNQFDVVIGNPPWLTYRESRRNLQRTIEEVTQVEAIAPEPRVKNSFNLAVAFFMTASHFLKAKGRIGFVLPISVLEAASHAPFVRMLLDGARFQILEMYDFSDVQPAPFPHTLGACVIVAEVGN